MIVNKNLLRMFVCDIIDSDLMKGERRLMRRKQSIRSMIFVSLFATLMCIGAWIHFPSPVPASMQTFVVFCALGLMGSKKTFVMLVLYIMMGSVGLPVFSGFTGGIGALTGPTAGFIWGFLLGVPVFYIFEKKYTDKRIIIGYILYILLHYIPGAVWYCIFTVSALTLPGLVSSTVVTVVPFIVPDAVKLILSFMTVSRLKRTVITNL